MTGAYNSVPLIVKKMFLELASALSAGSTYKTQCFIHLGFSPTLRLINGISSDLQKFLRYLNDAAIVVCL